MRYFVPQLDLAETEDAASAHAEHLGGLPFGLPISLWPICKECGGSQSLLAQFAHDSDRLNLGREGRVLYVFQCNHDPGMCATWEAFSGANHCLVLEPETLMRAVTQIPTDNPPLDNAAIINGWVERVSPLPESIKSAFFSDETFFALGDDDLADITWSTRLGGAPRWLQGAEEGPAGWRFLGQLDSVYSFLSAPTRHTSWITPDGEGFEGRTHVGEGPNFGGGIAYLFASDESDVPQVVMLWQR
ncbi:hypothetical protein SAMN05518849_101198 [Sphingobium sp. AP50]|uniref:hypothetical protein n=1 Tax=Sphingobium sp. AP50 TaxID=1884369 RepID=UPI0008CD6962|nr:hypothetical protein [Sphingobium sp. AP50]SEI59233.1 hypothetical protein SAMN05518849_101198 [Sphingobium sp. AP50]